MTEAEMALRAKIARGLQRRAESCQLLADTTGIAGDRLVQALRAEVYREAAEFVENPPRRATGD